MDDRLNDALKYWSALLGLGGWDIEAKFAHRHDIKSYLADCYKHINLSRASIRLAYPNECEDIFSDWEQALVHELLHIRFWNSDHSGVDNVVHEQAIDRTATALVTLKRGRHDTD